MRDRAKARQQAEMLVDQMKVDEMAGQLKFDAPGIDRLGIAAYNWWNGSLHGVAGGGDCSGVFTGNCTGGGVERGSDV